MQPDIPAILDGAAWAPEAGRMPQAAQELQACVDYMRTLTPEGMLAPMVQFLSLVHAAMVVEAELPSTYTYTAAAGAVRLIRRTWTRRPAELTAAFLPLVPLAATKLAWCAKHGTDPAMVQRDIARTAPVISPELLERAEDLKRQSKAYADDMRAKAKRLTDGI